MVKFIKRNAMAFIFSIIVMIFLVNNVQARRIPYENIPHVESSIEETLSIIGEEDKNLPMLSEIILGVHNRKISLDINQYITYTQEVVIDTEITFAKILLRVATHNRENTNTTTIEIYKNDNLEYTYYLPSEGLKDNSAIWIDGFSVDYSQGDIFKMQVYSTDATIDNCIVLYLFETGQDGGLYVEDSRENTKESQTGYIEMAFSENINIFNDILYEYQTMPFMAIFILSAMFLGIFTAIKILEFIVIDLIKKIKIN